MPTLSNTIHATPLTHGAVSSATALRASSRNSNASSNSATVFDEDIFESTIETGSNRPIVKKKSEKRYLETSDGPFWAKAIVKSILKISWQIGSSPDSIDGKPRVTGDHIYRVLPHLKPGDIILNGNGGGLSHLIMYIGYDQIIHSMATQNTMLGVSGSLWDNAKRYLGFGPKKELVGVLKEKLTGFLDRYERDTYVVVRNLNLSQEQIQKGINAIEEFVGSEYDYDFSAGDNEYYCTELAHEFLKSATGEAPEFETSHVTVPGLLDTYAIEPLHVLTAPFLTPVVANQSAKNSWKEEVGDALITNPKQENRY